MSHTPAAQFDWVAARERLGIDRLVLQIHDGCFPSDAEEDCGRGSPYSHGADRLYRFAVEHGFNAIQLGPQGRTQRGNASPYDGTLFSRNPLNLPLLRMVEQGRLPRESLEAVQRAVQSVPPPGPYSLIQDAYQQALDEIADRASSHDREQAGRYLQEHAAWLVPDTLYDRLCAEHLSTWFGEWPRTPEGAFDYRLFDPRPGEEQLAAARLAELKQKYAREIEDYALIQWLLSGEHRALRERLRTLGLTLYADLQVGLASQDMWARRKLFLPAYQLGAPPSRTNPAGQPWGYTVLDPQQYGTLDSPGPVLQFVEERLARVLTECDSVRIDHPHGWVDPWVYRTDDPDPLHAVQHGSRLFSSPTEPDHPLLHSWSIARRDQIDDSQTRYADHRVRDLDDAQVAQYAVLIDLIVRGVEDRGPIASNIACEVLSTMPYPVQRSMQRHGIGRFRVVSKLNLSDPTDVYRIENSRPEDWIMPGTHDTPSVWHFVNEWVEKGLGPKWADYLATLLATPANQPSLASDIGRSPGTLVEGIFSAILASPARHVSVFFPDLFGGTERYNQPGIVDDSNWRLRLPDDFEQVHSARCAKGEAIDMERCFETALRSKNLN
jgi:4-alpha-glucanotransferase